MNFFKEMNQRIEEQGKNKALQKSAKEFANESIKSQYSYNFTWMGRPVIQYPQDIMAMQQLIWEVQPDLIIETGIARGGSLIFYASMLELLQKDGMVLGVDIDIREHNKKAIVDHPMYKRIEMIQGSSIDTDIVSKVKDFAYKYKKIMVVLDSNHTHDHVLEELKLYSGFVSMNSYLVVFDTIVEDLPEECIFDRPWGKGNNPKSAVYEWLKTHSNFEIDKAMDNRLLVSVAPNGYLKRVK